MADTRITDLTAITGANTAAGDQFVLVDVSDTTMAASGTDKKITKAELLNVFEAAGATATHIADTSAAHAASAVSFSATGTIAATDVQAAVAEVATDAATALSTHEADTTSVHGIADTSALLTTSSSVNALADVTITTPSSGQVLKYNGSAWVNDTDATGGGGGTLNDLTDVTITAAATGDIVRYDGAAWVDTPGTTHFEVAGAVATHEADTTSVHGIADTSALVLNTRTISTTTPLSGGGALSSNLTLSVGAASDTASGVVELATTAETTTGTDTARAVTPAGLLNATTASNINARVAVKKAGTLQGTRRGINFIEGSGVTITTADDAGNEEVDVTIAASGSSTPARDVPFSLDAGTTRHGVIPGVVFTKAAVASATLGGSSSTAFTYFPIFVSEAITIDALQLNVWTLGASANFRLGLYNANAYWFPTTLVVDAGAASAGSTGVKTLSFSNTAVPAGRYYLCVQPDGVAAFTPLTIFGNMTGGWGFGQDAQLFPTTLRTNSTTYAALPATAFTTGLAKTTTADPGMLHHVWMRSV